jgi:hypothetical protein
LEAGVVRSSRRLFIGGIGVAAWLVAFPALLIAWVPVASAARSVAGEAAFRAALAHRPGVTPFRHPKPAALPPGLATPAVSPWTPLKNPPPFAGGTMLLASDGTVLVHVEPASGGTADWYRLRPSSKGSYINGTWSKIPAMPSGYAPLYFASAILPDGRLIVEGGEYLGGNGVWTNRGALYNPVSNSWRTVPPPPGWANIGDAQSNVLANGTFMIAQACQNCTSPDGTLSTADALFNASTLNWNVINFGKNDPNDEEAWTLEPSGQLLTVDTWLTPTTELFTPNILAWSNAGNTVGSPVNSPAAEIGPQVEMPGGNTFVVGAGNGPEAPAPCTTKTRASTSLYQYVPGTSGRWRAGPSIPTLGGMQYDSADGPGSILPDGNVLFDASPCVFNAPIVFFVYNASSNTLTRVPDVRNAGNDSTYNTRLLLLPNGQVLFDDGGSQMEVYTAGGTPHSAWAPSITSVSSTSLRPGQTYKLDGTQLAGLDQGATYGDDSQSNTNFPVIRIKNSKTGVVTYARTSHWSSVSVAPGTSSSTNFTLPKTIPSGAGTLVVVANGIASRPVTVSIF